MASSSSTKAAAAAAAATLAPGLLNSSPPISTIHRRLLSCSTAARTVSRPPDLIRWVLREGGFVHPSLEVADNGNHGLGVIATEEIPGGSDLIALPGHLPLQLRRAAAASATEEGGDAVVAQLALRVPEELWAMKLGLRLLQERAANNSFWWPYICNLPDTFSMPIFFPGDDIKNLQYAPFVHQVNKRCHFLLEFQKEVKAMLEDVVPENHPFGCQVVNASSLGWAMSSVSSRAFRLHGEIFSNGKRSNIPMLLPLIDMCNHSFLPNARIIQEEHANNPNMSVKVVSETKIKKDCPVMLNYGCLSNDLFLLDYGFVVPSNSYDHVELKYDSSLLEAASVAAGFSSPSFASPEEWQQVILYRLNLQGKVADLKVILGGPGMVDGRLMAALRILFSKDQDAARNHDLSVLMSLTDAAVPLGSSVEAAALRTLIALCILVLESFPTKVMQDESLIKGGLSRTMELAVQFRMHKKLMIIDTMQKLAEKKAKLARAQ